MKLWDKGYDISAEIENFTVGKDRDLDLLLAKYDVLGSMAHGKMLRETGLLSDQDFRAIYRELQNILRQIETGNFRIEAGVEDIHSQIELMLTRKLGETGKRIHAGRSRNDQILVDLRLFVRDEIKEIVTETKSLFDLLIHLSESHKEKFLPGYTHMQIAMPSSFGLWFGAYAESLADDLVVLQSAYRVVDRNPLGSAAGYGSSLPLNRELTTSLLGFETLNFNSVYAAMGRGKTERVVSSALAFIASTLSKFAADVCIYMNQNFGFISFPDEFTTGSSIMPHKKNPDVFELIRAKCNKLQALPNQFTLISGNMPSGYHRDFQILKEDFLPAFEILKDCLRVARLMLKNIQINTKIEGKEIYKNLSSVDAVNQLVLQGMSFRSAYQKVAAQIERGEFVSPKNIQYTHEGSIGNLQNEKIVEQMEKVVKLFNFGRAEKAIQNLRK